MIHSASVIFRDERESVLYEAFADGDGVIIEWWLEGLSNKEHDALQITDDEENEVASQCYAAYCGIESNLEPIYAGLCV